MKPSPPQPISIIAHNISKTYTIFDRPSDRLRQLLWRDRRQYGRRFVALDNVSFELHKGEVLGIVGRNGAGKSTLLQIVCGTLTPTSGWIKTNGRVAALLELGAGFNPEFTGRENAFMNAALLGIDAEEMRVRFPDIVAFSGLADFIDQPIKTYSSGMVVRLAFSIATAFDPEILVIDEALSVGDGAFARKSFDRIMQLKERGTTILFCSHSMYQVDALCERALWLEAGRVQMLDAATKVTAAYNNFLLRETAPPPATVAPPPPPEPHGSAGTAHITRVIGYADGIEGRELPLRSRHSTLAITVEFVSDPSLPCPSVALSFENEANIMVSSTIGFAQNGAVQREENGHGKANVVFPQIPLLKGRFYVSVYLACERGLHFYEAANRCLTLEVSQDDVLQGVTALPHRWETSECQKCN